MTEAETYERHRGPLRMVVERGRKIPLAPPLPGESEPFAWSYEPDRVVSMDVDGRPVESATITFEDGQPQMVVLFKDGGHVSYNPGQN